MAITQLDDATKDWTFPLSKMKGMTPEKYASLRAKAANPNTPQVCAAVISGFTCVGKTTFGAQCKPKYGGHRVINLEYNQYRSQNNGKDVDDAGYLNDTLIAAKFIPGAIIVVNCHQHFRRAMQKSELDYVRVYPNFNNPAVKEDWLARARGRTQGGGAKFAERMNECWGVWSEMGKGFEGETSPSVVLKVKEYLGTRVGDILTVAGEQRVARQQRVRQPQQSTATKPPQQQQQRLALRPQTQQQTATKPQQQTAAKPQQQNQKQVCAALISGFPAIGKSSLQKTMESGNSKAHSTSSTSSTSSSKEKQNQPSPRYKVYDLDSSNYKVQKDPKTTDWPTYLSAIQKHIQIPNAIVLVSCHREIRRRMQDAGMRYIRVFPDPHLKSEWIARDQARGGALSGFLKANWEGIVKEVMVGFEGEDPAKRVVLGKKCFLSGHIGQILELSSSSSRSGPGSSGSRGCGDDRCCFSRG